MDRTQLLNNERGGAVRWMQEGWRIAKGSEESRSRKGGDSARRAKSKSTTANSGWEEGEQGYTETEKKKEPHTRVAHGGGKWRHAREWVACGVE